MTVYLPELTNRRERAVSALIEEIYAGVGKEEGWTGFLDSLTETVGGEKTLIFGSVLHAGVAANARTPVKMVQDFLGHYAGVNVLAPACDRMFRTGEVRYSHWAVPDGEFERSEFYNDFFGRHDLFYSMGLKISLDGGNGAYLSCQRSRACGPFDEREGVVYAALLPHLRRALGLHARFREMDVRGAGLESSLERFGHSAIGIDTQGRVAFCTAGAESLLGRDTGMRLAVGGVSCAKSGEQEGLRRLLKETIAGGGGGAVWLNRAGQGPLRVTVSPYRGALPGCRSALAALVFIHDLAQTPPPRAASMQALYGLTPTELRVADLLLEGLDTREVGQRLHMALETARFHVKRVLAKTGTRRQSELMRLMLSLPHQA